MRAYRDAVAAACVAAMVNAVLLVFLVRATRIEVATSDTPVPVSTLQVTWIKRAPPAPPGFTPPSAASAPTRTEPARTRKRRPPASAGAPTTPSPMEMIATPIVIGTHLMGEPRLNFSPNPLAPSPRDVARRNILPAFDMRDTTLLGKLTGMGQASLCHELRQLARGSDGLLATRRVSRDVVLRTMQERGCPL